ncbi:MAG: hypothetical protein ACRDFB_06430 [Rhabdochlamydiaceae bacterium]
MGKNYFPNSIVPTPPGASGTVPTSNGVNQPVTWQPVGSSSSDHKVIVDANDTTAEYLGAKLSAGTDITLTVINPDGNEKIEIASTGGVQDVTSVFGRTGAVVATSGDYTPADVGALASNASVGGDLSGTVPDPTVASIGGIVVSLAAGVTGDVLTQQSNGTFKPSAVPAADVTSVFGRTGAIVAEGGDYTASDVGALANNATLGGDLSGTVPNPTVAKIGGVAVSLSAGSTGYLLTQKTDGSFAPQAADAQDVTSVFGRTGAVVAESGDYTAADVSALADNATVGGDLSGTVPNPTVAKIGGVVVSLGSGATGDILTQQSNGSFAPATVPSKSFEESRTIAWSGDVAVPSGATAYLPPFFEPVLSGTSKVLVSARYMIRAGTSATFEITQNGTAVTGLSSLSATTTAAYTTATSTPSVTDGDQFAVVVSAISGVPDGLTVSLIFKTTN